MHILGKLAVSLRVKMRTTSDIRTAYVLRPLSDVESDKFEIISAMNHYSNVTMNDCNTGLSATLYRRSFVMYRFRGWLDPPCFPNAMV